MLDFMGEGKNNSRRDTEGPDQSCPAVERLITKLRDLRRWHPPLSRMFLSRAGQSHVRPLCQGLAPLGRGVPPLSMDRQRGELCKTAELSDPVCETK